MLQAVSWWAAIQVLGLMALPISFRVFRSLPDKGYAFSKMLGLLLFSYIAWLSASVKILPNHKYALVFFLLAAGGVFTGWVFKHSCGVRPGAPCRYGEDDTRGRYSERNPLAELGSHLKRRMPLVLAVEVIFAAAFALWAVVRSYAPAITATEKPMDLAFLNSILRANYLPPPDPWLSGFSLNNYYFGHFIVALLSKLTGVPAGTAYNLAVAIFFGLSAIGIFGLVYNLVARSSGDEAQRKAIGFGLLGILFFLIASNLEGVIEFLYARGAGSPEFWKWVDIKGLNQPYASARWYPTEHWFFWRATRVIDTVVGGQSLDYTITEFPFFSFLLADMHAHLLAIPFVLMALGFTMNTLFTREPMGFRWLLRNPWELLVVIIGLGSLGVIHSWDLPTYAGIFVAAVFIQHYLAPAGGIRGRAVTAHPLPREGTSLLPSPELPVVPVSAARRLTGLPLLAPVVISLIVLAGVFFYYLPFYSAFQRPVTGVLPWIGPPTRSVYWLVLYGLFALIILPALIVEAASLKKDGQGAAKTLALLAPVMLGPLVIWTLLMMVVGPVTAGPASAASGIAIRWRNLIPFVLLALGALWVVIIRSKKVRQDSPWGLGSLYVALLLLAAILIIYGTELFFIKDVLFGNRMNTIFRFHYQVWLLLSVAAAFGVYYISARGRGLTAPWRISQIAWLAVTAVVFLGALYYPAAAASNYLNFKASRTLDGLAFVAPPERDALEWLRKNVPEGSVIAEAFGGDYTEAGRVAARTGIPTIIEWAEHQKIWRGADQDFKDRPRDVEAIFRSANVSQVRSLLAKYGVSYIYVGGFERQQYGDQVSTRFNGVADIVFRNQAATVYRVRAQ